MMSGGCVGFRVGSLNIRHLFRACPCNEEAGDRGLRT